MPGYVNGRAELARWLASADVYVSGMADETFGISIVEAQASGLPVVGVAAGAMIDRVTNAVGRLGPVGDAGAMAANILEVLQMDLGAVADQARAEARRNSWDHSMEALFGRVYPAAFARRAAGLLPPPLPPHLQPDGSTRIHLILRKSFREKARGKRMLLLARGLIGAQAVTAAAPPAAAQSLLQNCDAHKFETIVETKVDGVPRRSKVKLCGNEGQSDADWIKTLKDASDKAKANVQMQKAMRDQIVAAIEIEIARLNAAAGTTVTGAMPAPRQTIKPIASSDYAPLPPLPTAPTAPTKVLATGPDGNPVSSAAKAQLLLFQPQRHCRRWSLHRL